MTTLAPDTDTVIQHLEDWDPACAMSHCEAEHPTAVWIYRSNLGCGHDETVLCCEGCRLRGIRLGLIAIAQGLDAICRVCGYAKPLTVVEDAFTYEPLRGGQ